MAVGSQLLSIAKHEVTPTIRRALQRLAFPKPGDFILKGFRAGHATWLAANGKPLGQILAWGEWKSRAFLDYVDETSVDAVTFTDMVCDASDKEDENPPVGN